MGGLRFDVMGVWKMLKLKHFPGKLTFSKTLTDPSKMPKLNEDIKGDEWESIEGRNIISGLIE